MYLPLYKLRFTLLLAEPAGCRCVLSTHIRDIDYNAGLAEAQQLVSEALVQVLHTTSKTAGGANLTRTNIISSSRHLLSGSSAVQAADIVSTTEVTPEHEGLTASSSRAVLLQ